MRTYIHIPYIIGLAMILATTSVSAGYWDNYLRSYVMVTAADESLLKAAFNNDTEKAREAITNGANVNIQTREHKSTPLHLAAEKGNIEISQLLIDNDATVNPQDADKETPLHYVAELGNPKHIDVLELLIHNDADVNVHNIKQQTPLHVATKTGDELTLKLLIHHAGANVNVDLQNIEQLTPRADHNGPIYHHGPHALARGTKLLIRNGIEINRQNTKTLLQIAANTGDLELEKLLIHNGADRNIRTPTDIFHSQGNTDIQRLFSQIQHLHNNNIDHVITNETSIEDRQFYAEAMIASGYLQRAQYIIQNYLKNLSDDTYANIMLHAARHRKNIDKKEFERFITFMHDTYENDSKAQAIVNIVGHSNTPANVVAWVLDNYEDRCRQFCDENGNTIAHRSASAQLNSLLPRIMTLVMQNNNLNPRNKDNETPVMLRRKIGNHIGADIIAHIVRIRNVLSQVSPQIIAKKEQMNNRRTAAACARNLPFLECIELAQPQHDHLQNKSSATLPPELADHIILFIDSKYMQQHASYTSRTLARIGYQRNND